MNGILLSAGLGFRLRPYTELVPKPTIPFLSVPLACYSLSLFEKIKIHTLVINTHHLSEEVEFFYKNLMWPSNKKPGRLVFSHEPQILGSGGGVRRGIQHLVGRGVFFVANADEVILPEDYMVMREALDFHRQHGGIATLLCLSHPGIGETFGGVWLKEGDSTRVACFSKKAVEGHRGLHFVGLILLSDSIEGYFFDDDSREENILYDTLTRAMEEGEEVHAFEIQAQWFETGNPADFMEGSRRALLGIQTDPPPLWAEYLGQLICRCGISVRVIEKDYPEFLCLMEITLQKVLEGSLRKG